MSETTTTRETRRASAEQYRSSVIAAGAQSRAGTEFERANQLEAGAATLRTEAQQDTVTAKRGTARMHT